MDDEMTLPPRRAGLRFKVEAGLVVLGYYGGRPGTIADGAGNDHEARFIDLTPEQAENVAADLTFHARQAREGEPNSGSPVMGDEGRFEGHASAWARRTVELIRRGLDDGTIRQCRHLTEGEMPDLATVINTGETVRVPPWRAVGLKYRVMACNRRECWLELEPKMATAPATCDRCRQKTGDNPVVECYAFASGQMLAYDLCEECDALDQADSQASGGAAVN